MRATLMYGAGDVRVDEVLDPVIQQPTDAIVRVVRGSTCGSDLWPYKSKTPTDKGQRMGHEFVGLIEDVGADVTGLKKGDVVRVTDTCRELKGIIKNMAKQVAASDWQAIARIDMQFHTAFVSGTGNTRLIRIYETLTAESRMCILSLEVAYPRRDVLVQEHQNILDLLEARDRSGLQQAIKRHLEEAKGLVGTSPDAEITD